MNTSLKTTQFYNKKLQHNYNGAYFPLRCFTRSLLVSFSRIQDQIRPPLPPKILPQGLVHLKIEVITLKTNQNQEKFKKKARKGLK